jgi:pilus assembly protein FimV
MALGFGFNKAKVLASAEKNVQQGKLHNAITEYEKIVNKDPKDLTVLNTIGDLYARIGENEKAGEFFKRVGDTYAGEGFTVKAIAMYKKLTKLNPGATVVVLRLAELYTQQGLYNDARQQYLLLADACLKANDTNGAARIFQKMLDMDPDNVTLQTKLADLYVKSGKKNEARDIFLRAATSLYDRGSAEQADQAFERMLSLDPSNVDALFMRGKIALEANDGATAAKYLDKVPNIDSRADGLQLLMKAYILSSDDEHAEGVARKLSSVHNDLSGVRAYAEFLISAGKSEAALALYDEFVDRLVVGDTGELTMALQGLTGQLKDSVEALEKLRSVFQKAGAAANIPEVNELLAHACVKAGDLAKARDLYKELADIEPSNPQHMQNYRQVQKRMGEEPTAKQLPATQGSQAFFIEEIDTPLPTMPDYPPALQEKILNVLTDAELFESYNKPLQAVKPLESILEKAPRDVRINQRLASIYGRIGRFEDAAYRCDILREMYGEAGLDAEAKKYGEMSVRFREEAGIPASEMPVYVPPAASAAAAAPMASPAAPALPETAEFTVVPAGEAHEIDLSSEWDAATTEILIEPPVEAKAKEPQPVELPEDVQEEELGPSAISDLLEEVKFYLAQEMWEEARVAIQRCETLAPANFELVGLKQQLKSGIASEAAAPKPAAVVEVETAAPTQSPTEEDATVVEYDFDAEVEEPVEDEVAGEPTAKKGAAEPVPVLQEPQVEETVPEIEVAAAEVEEVAEVTIEEEPVLEEIAVAQPEPDVKLVEQLQEEREPVPSIIEDRSATVPQPEPEPVMAVASAPAQEKDVLSDLVLDLEDALGDDFGIPPQKVAHESGAAVAAMAASAVNTSSGISPNFADSIPVSSVAAPLSRSTATEESSVLSDLFAEFKEEVGEATEETEDPETHYNLGVAFKEMGLLDEAIGELQKVCKAIDRGSEFSQVMQAYTWLASCFVEKGVPEAAVKWYEKALTISTSQDSRTALHYDLAGAYEAAGDRALALKHFTEVYGTNIDYRDVAERIKALRS